MLTSARFVVGVVAVLVSLAAMVQAVGVVIDRDGSVIAGQGVGEIAKEQFLAYLDTKQSMLIGFYQRDDGESDKALNDMYAFAEEAASRYPDLQLGKVDFRRNPYLTARMLLTGAEEMAHYMDNQLWLDEAPLGSQAQMYCSPFNLCGKTLAFIAEKSSLVESALPIPKWLAMILIPAIITFAGRFIIDGMYGAEEQIRNVLGLPRAADANGEALSDVESDTEQSADAGASSNKDLGQPKKKKTQ